MMEQNETRRPKGDAVRMSKTETPFEQLYQPSITDLEREERKATPRIVVYLDDALAAHNQEVRQVLEGLKSHEFKVDIKTTREGVQAANEALRYVNTYIDSLLERYK